jgi:hypothetical protein
MKRRTRLLLIFAICAPVILLIGLAIHCSYLTWQAKRYLKAMNSAQIGLMTRQQYLDRFKSFRSAQGSCSSGSEKEDCYVFGFSSPLLVRLHVLPDTVMFGNAFFVNGILVQKTEYFKSRNFSISVDEGKPDPYTEFGSRVYIATSTGSKSGYHIQVNPQATPQMKAPVYDFQMKCFILSGLCREAHDALPKVETHDSD